jgi:hypothetical protein
MPRYEFTKPGRPDRSGVNPFTRQPIVIKGIPADHRFWEIEIDGTVLHFAAGHVGKNPLRWSRDCADSRRAQQAYEAGIASRTAAGFRHTGEAIVLREKTGTMSSPLGIWEERIASAPDDDHLLAQCATALREGDDIHLGELPSHLAEWAGQGDERTISVEWHAGFARTARVAFRSWEGQEVPLADVVGDLLRHPVGRFVRSLTIGLNNVHGQCQYEEVIAAIGAAQPPVLQSLFVGDFEFPDETELSWAHVGECDPLWTLPTLRELTLQGASIHLGVVDAPSLEELELRTGGLPRHAIVSLSQANAPRLQKLKVWFGDSNYGGECQASDVELLLDGKNFPALRELGLMNAEFTDDLCAKVLASDILPRLETLDLSHGTLTDDGAAILGQGIASLKHLRRLVVGGNLMSEKGRRALATLGDALDFGDQRTGDAEDRFVAFGE